MQQLVSAEGIDSLAETLLNRLYFILLFDFAHKKDIAMPDSMLPAKPHTPIADTLRKQVRSIYHTVIPLNIRLDIWYRRHTGQSYKDSLPPKITLPETAIPAAQVHAAQIQESAAPQYGKTAIIIVSYNNAAVTSFTLQSVLEKTTGPNYEIIIVDNGSQSETIAMLEEYTRTFANVRLIKNGENKGFAAANNIGVGAAEGCEYFVLLNNDVIVTPNWLFQLLKYASQAEIGMVGPVTSHASNEARIPIPYTSAAEIDAFAEAFTTAHAGSFFDIRTPNMFCVALRADTVQKIGLLDERFGLGNFEDDDYALRIRNAGLRTICAEDVFVHHIGGSTFSKLAAENYQKLLEKNRQLFETKWNVLWQPPRARKKSASRG